MDEVLAIAQSTWQRILKMFVVYLLVGCAIIEIGITLLYDTLTMHHHRMLMVDLSLVLTTMAGLLTVLALAFDLPREMREGGAATLLSKPIGRYQYLLGKYFGILLVSLVVTGMIATGFCLVHWLSFKSLPPSAIQGHILAVVQVIPIAAIGLFFAALLSEAAAAIMTAVTVWIAHSTPMLAKYPIVYGGLLPDLNLFNMRAEATYNVAINGPYLLMVAAWGIAYSVALFALTALIFNQRDLK